MTEQHWKDICELAKDRDALDSVLQHLDDEVKVSEAVQQKRLADLQAAKTRMQATMNALDAQIAELTP